MSEEIIQNKASESKKYSIVIPVFNEDDSIGPLLAEIIKVMKVVDKPYEVVFVNDGSTDGSLKTLEGIHSRVPDRVQLVDLPQRGGQTNALRQGLNAATGEVVITMDADLQNDPEDIPKLITKMEETGADCVCGWRKNRQDTMLKAGLSKLGNILQRLFTGLKIHDVSCTLRAYKRACVKNIPLNWEGQHRFIPLCLSLQGYKVEEIVSNHRYRQYGHSKYTHGRIFRVMSDFFRILQTRGKA